MARVTSTLIIHRPERLLYYLPEVTDEVQVCIRDGVCPAAFKAYQHGFGTYDDVGIFYLPEKAKADVGQDWVVGLEFRMNDERVKLPEDLPCIVIPESYMITMDVAYEYQLNEELLRETIEKVRYENVERISANQYVEGGLVTAFSVKEKLRVMYEISFPTDKKYAVDCGGGKFTNDELYIKAYTEPITGYYNWTWMNECLQNYHKRGVTDYCFVHFDVKDFNMINELYNHNVANVVLRRIAENMKRHSDWVYFGARCDNDNFAMMIRDMPEDEIREKLGRFFDEISRLDADPRYQIFYRCGVVTMRYAMNSGDIVADCAKLAQSMGTEINKTEIHFYTKEMHENALWGKQLKAYLDTAIRANEFEVYFQPKFDAKKNEICGAEALVRWNYKHKKMLTPYRFVPYFEMDDSIIKVDEFVLHRVCAKLKRWKEKGYKVYPVSVNLSRKHMVKPYLASHLAAIVDSYGVDRALIEFELTETMAYENQAYMISVLGDLKAKGFQISMDDFGTGYSSFALLKEMPLDTLKIDKSFVDLIVDGDDCEKIKIILSHIISMSRELGISSIAEGVEEQSQIEVLKELGCDTIQGYYYSKPVTVREFEKKYLASGT